MKTVKNILRSIWAVWGILLFGLVAIASLPFGIILFVFFKERGVRFFIWFGYRFHTRFLLLFYFIFVKNHGKEKVPDRECYVIVSNHQSQLDILINALTTPSLYKFLSKAEAAKIPVLGYFIKNACILVDRSSKESRKQGFENMAKTIRDGYSVLIYPEGTRNRTDQPLTNMYDGAFRLAIMTQTPILVTTLVGAGKLSDPNRKVDLSPGIVHAYWDKPISTVGLTEEDIPKLKKSVEATMMKHLKGA